MGYDVHALVEGRKLILGGVELHHSLGLLGHSDADVLIHALCDAILGAANLGDIGSHFPDTDSKYKSIDSKRLLVESMRLIREAGFELANADMTVCAQRPKISSHIPAMKQALATCMKVTEAAISIKATTTERLGFVGKEEGISAYAVVLIEKRP